MKRYFFAIMFTRFVLTLLLGFLTASAWARAISTPIMPLKEVKPGMKGEWRTVVSGTEIKSFPLEVIGISENFIGAKESVILCQATDPVDINIGTVAGMSGSPVYIDGKLIGAYAYGWPFPKDQALIGVTPIESMLSILDYGEAVNEGGSATIELRSKKPGEYSSSKNSAKQEDAFSMHSAIALLPTTIMACGISEKTLNFFKSELQNYGFNPALSPSGTMASKNLVESDLQPGSAVTGILMNGDFGLAATGTVTWREGNNLLAFGHRFFMMGGCEIPMGSAEIVTVVQSYFTSFKLANMGPVVGTIYQDRLHGIAGKIGKMPDMIAFDIRKKSKLGEDNYSGNLIKHRSLSSLIASVGLMESLNESMDREAEQTLYTDVKIEIENADPITLKNVFTGEDARERFVLDFSNQLRLLMDNEFEYPDVRRIQIDLALKDGWHASVLDSVIVESGILYSGDKLKAKIGVKNYLDEDKNYPLEIMIPSGMQACNLRLFIGDVYALNELEGRSMSKNLNSFKDVLKTLKENRSNGKIYIKLLQSAPGLEINGVRMPDLPSSVMALYQSPKNQFLQEPIYEVVLWEGQIDVPGEFRGVKSLSIKVH